MEESDMKQTPEPNRPPGPVNLIFYGPPGTGKTYETAAEAVRLCDGFASTDRTVLMMRYRELFAAKRIAFVTFHQSYAYEDFIEGLRPVSGLENDDYDAPPSVAAGFSLKPQDGIFKEIADLARDNRGRPGQNDVTIVDRKRKVFKMSLGRSQAPEDDPIFEDAIAGGYVVLGWGGDIDWSDARYGDFDVIKSKWQSVNPNATGYDPNITQIFTLRGNMEIGSLIVISDGNRKFRAIGEITGPYYFQADPTGYNHRRSVKWLWHSETSLASQLIYGKNFSQVSAYQLVSGLVDWDGLEQIVAGAGASAAAEVGPEAFVLIIDEINRGNVSKIFGELITLIEPDKRAGSVNALSATLPYSKTQFTVPRNLHIIGTMNSADRSIALLDTALRRRFHFSELMPDASLLGVVDGIDLAALLTTLNSRIEYLFDRDHQIGHAYFLDCDSRAGVDRTIRDSVIPLLVEYFYEDWEKVRQVLGESANTGAFIKRTPLKPPPGCDPEDGYDGTRWRYTVCESFALTAYDQLLP